jgi:hypothetical protein
MTGARGVTRLAATTVASLIEALFRKRRADPRENRLRRAGVGTFDAEPAQDIAMMYAGKEQFG